MDISPTIQKEINDRIASGRYRSTEDLRRRALDSLNLFEHGEDALRAEIAMGVEQLDRGESIPGSQVVEELRQRNRNLGSAAG